MVSDRIIIYCDNVSEKHGKKHPNPVVWAYRYDESHRDGTGQGWLDDIRSKRLRKSMARRKPSQILVGNDKFDRAKFTINNREEWKDHLRESWVLPCDKCGYEVRIVDKKLYPVLDRMREVGLSQIGLLTLEERLFSQSN